MPSVSKKQHRFMQAIAHSPEFAKKAGVPVKVGKEFMKADKGRKFGGGGMATERPFPAEPTEAELKRMRQQKRDAEQDRMMEESGKRYDEIVGKARGGRVSEYGGAETYKSPAARKKHEKAEPRAMEMAEKAADSAVKAHEKRMHKGMKAGGMVRGDGIAQRGKTKGRYC